MYHLYNNRNINMKGRKMRKTKDSTVAQDMKAVNELVDQLTLFDDDLMSRVFDGNITATELILRIIMGEEVKVLKVNSQNTLKNPEIGGRNIVLDVRALDVNGREINIEVQGNAEGAHVKRARFHSAMIDSRSLKAGQDFKEMKDSYVIFIYKGDKFRQGLPIYHIDRYVEEKEVPFGDGSHIIYVNGSYIGDDEIGYLIRDFYQKNAKDIFYKELADGVKHFKENEEGREIMCEAVEKYAKEYAKVCADEREFYANVKSVRNLMENVGFSLEQALDGLGIQGDSREKIAEQLHA